MLQFHLANRIANPDSIILTKGLLKNKFQFGINNMVDKIKEISSASWAAPVLLTILLGYNIFNTQQTNNQLTEYKKEQAVQHDLLIRIQQQKEDQDKFSEKERQEILSKLDQAENWRKVLDGKILELKYSKQIKENNH